MLNIGSINKVLSSRLKVNGTMLKTQSVKQLRNPGLRINQGCNLKWKLGDKQENQLHFLKHYEIELLNSSNNSRALSCLISLDLEFTLNSWLEATLNAVC